MTDVFSSHAPTGESEVYIVNSNPYDPRGREIGFPNKFSVYPNKFDSNDGSQLITENRKVSDIQGNRLYLYHRPVVDSDGTVSVTTTDGTIATSLTEPRQGYVVFSTLPTSDFSISYVASPDCLSMWYFNNLQNDIMEVQKYLGSNTLTGYPSIRNLALASFDNPIDANLSGVLNRGVYLSHLDADIYIGSTTDAALTGSRGIAHKITFGGGQDQVEFDVTGLEIKNSDPTATTRIQLGSKTGDFVSWSGQLSGEGPITVGGPSWPGYSGVIGGALTTGYYNSSMLKVNGDVAILGDLQAVGSITIVNLTGEVSTVIGDFTITDDLTVNDTSTLIGVVNTNRINAAEDIHIDADIVAENVRGNGGNGQSLVDNLDCSEVAHSYNTVISSHLRNSVLKGRPKLDKHIEGDIIPRWLGNISGVVENCFVFSGFANANAGPSGVHPNIIQVNFTDDNLPVVPGTYFGISGTTSGIWSPGMMDPGSLWITDGNNGFESPIYGYTIESGNSTSVLRMNVFCPELDSNRVVQTNDPLFLYYKHSRPYNFLSAAGGASPTFQVFGSTQYPFEVSFEREVRRMTTSTSNISLTSALAASVTGLSTPSTGLAYIFAKADTDPENPPSFKARNIPYAMPNETAIGEVLASYNGSVWTILDTVNYAPESIVDTGWIPVKETGLVGRVLAPVVGLDKTYYFVHNLGIDQTLYKTSIDIYLGSYGTGSPGVGWDQAQPLAYSLACRDTRVEAGFSGAFSRVTLTNTHTSAGSSARDASLTYLDGKLIGISFDALIKDSFPHTATTPDVDYVRLVMRRDA